ncbi:MAG: sulfotransferase [Steroidobacteraceae bacterium]
MQSDAMSVTGALDAETLMQDARKQTGLSDFGLPDVRAALTVLVDALNEEARLSAAGREGTRASFTRVLANKLKIQDAFKRHPEILQESIAGPIVIVGLPRSGTTKLHRMMACDPGLQKLALWKIFNPVPLPDEAPGERSPRIQQAQAFVTALRDRHPDFYAAHPMDAEEPDEEEFLMELTFVGYLNALSAHVPSYAKWVHAQSFEGWYRLLRELLQYYQYCDGRLRSPWLLKAPAHLGQLKLLVKYFPDVTIVHCHRDPVEAIPSLAGLVAASRRFHSDVEQDKDVGDFVLELWSRQMRRYCEERKSVESSARIVDVTYRDIVRDAAGVIARIYSAAGLHPSAEALSRMCDWEQSNTQHKHGRHQYSLAQFGYEKGQLEAAFEEYRSRFSPLF